VISGVHFEESNLLNKSWNIRVPLQMVPLYVLEVVIDGAHDLAFAALKTTNQ
jgi:hypothetical protein